MKHALAWVEAPARLGAPVVRVFAGPQAPHKTWQAAADGAARADADHGEKYGVQVAV